MSILPLPGCDLYYEDHGNGPPSKPALMPPLMPPLMPALMPPLMPPLMMVAGLGGVATWWADTLAAFVPHFRIILHDQRGTGRSSRVPVHSIAQLADDARALMDHLGIAETRWLGHSTGGAIGVDLALDHPGRISHLVVNSSTTHGTPYRRRIFDIRRQLQRDAGPAAYAAFTTLLLYPPWYVDANTDRLAAEEQRSAAGLGPPEVQASRLDAILAWDRRAELDRLTPKTLILCAEDDILTPMHFSLDFAARIPGARLLRLPTGGHAVSRTRPDLFDPPVLDFLNS